MKPSILIPAGAVVLASVAFIAGRISVGQVSAAAESAVSSRIKPAASDRDLGAPAEVTKNPRPENPSRENAATLLNQLARLTVTEGDPRSARPVVAAFEALSRIGSKALPDIRQFLATGVDVTYLPSNGRRLRDVKSLLKALVPPSLRIGLLEMVARTGGKDAEVVLAENLALSKTGLELACLCELLQQATPGKYNDEVVAAVSALLAKGAAGDRNILFEVMKDLGDTTYVANAQQQMIHPDGKVDRDALRYLQQAMGPQSLGLASRSYQDPRLTEPGSKEPFARVALAYVGASPQALELFHAALLDPALLPDQKRNLVEDLNQDGLSNRKIPTAEDLQIITKRYELTQAYLQEGYVQGDAVLNAAFREADKDLRKMLERAATATGQ